MTEIQGDTTVTVGDALGWATGCLGSAKLAEPDREAEYLLMALLDCSKGALYLGRNKKMEQGSRAAFVNAVEKRCAGEPPQYIVGEQEFRGLSFKVDGRVLIPRPETELLVEEALKALASRKREREGEASPLVIDLCTGSGCVALSIAREYPSARCIATDISEPALSVARENAERLGIAERVTLLAGDLYAPLHRRDLEGRADVIVANPPYIASGEISSLQREVKCFEPDSALDGGVDGLDCVRRIIAGAPPFLAEEGCLILEIGYDQAERVKEIFEAEENDRRWISEVKRDYAGIERIVKARLVSKRGERDE